MKFSINPFFINTTEKKKKYNEEEENNYDENNINNSDNFNSSEKLTDSSNSKQSEKNGIEFISANDGYMIDKKLSQFDEKELNTNKNIRSIEKNNYITNHVDEKIENEDDPVNDKEENHNEHKKEDVSNKEKKEMLYKYSSKKKSKERRKIKINTKDSNEGGYLSLGICVRYAEEPFNKSKIVTFVNSYIFINRLPFDIKIVTDSVRKKSETFFISQNVNKLEINDTYKNLFQLERKKTERT